MTRAAKKKGSASRNRYSSEYKGEALALAEKIGVTAAAGQLSTEVVRLKRQLADQAEELAILKKRRRTSSETRHEVRLYGHTSG